MSQKIENLEKFSKSLFYLGMGEIEALKPEKIEEAFNAATDKRFSIEFTGPENSNIKLNLSRNEKSVYLDAFEVETTHLADNRKTIFFAQDSSTPTLKESINLIEGRYICKNIPTLDQDRKPDYSNKQEVWIGLNLEETINSERFGPVAKLDIYRKEYGFDLDASLETAKTKFGLTINDKFAMDKFKKGDLVQAKRMDGRDITIFADVKFKSIKSQTLYNGKVFTFNLDYKPKATNKAAGVEPGI